MPDYTIDKSDICKTPDYTMEKCDICKKEHKCYGYTDGHHICPKCFHAYYFGVSVERKQWEKWNKTTWKKMFDKYGNT